MASIQHLKIIRGDDQIFEVRVRDADGQVIDITNYGARFSVKCNYADVTPAILKSLGDGITFTDPVNGILTVVLDAADTSVDARKYLYDVELTDDIGRTITAIIGNFLVEHDISR